MENLFMLMFTARTVALALTVSSAWAQTYRIDTFAGGGMPSTPAVATSAALPVKSVATDLGGNFYVSTGRAIFKVMPSGTMTRFAGAPGGGAGLGDGGPATNAVLNMEGGGMAVDASGNLYLADCLNHRVRKITQGGIISTVAGTGESWSSGDGGPAVNAQVPNPHGVAIDSSGTLYFSDNYSSVRKVTADGIISTVAGTRSPGYSGDGGPATSAKVRAYGIALDAARNLYIAEPTGARVRKVTPEGTITTYAGTGTMGDSGDGGPATSAKLSSPIGLAVDSGGNLYIADSAVFVVRKVTPGGIISTVAGKDVAGYCCDGGPAVNAGLYEPVSLAIDPNGSLYIADKSDHRVRKISAAGVITTAAGKGLGYSGDGGPAANAQLDSPRSVTVNASGEVLVTDSASGLVRKVSGGVISKVAGNGALTHSGDDGSAASAGIAYPAGVASDSSGNVYISEYLGNAIRKVTPAGMISTIAGNGFSGYTGDGGPATQARINHPVGLVVGPGGDLYVADASNNRIRKITPAGAVSTVAGTGTADYSGDGGQATAAALNSPRQMAFDAAGNLYIADTINHRIRKVTPAGVISTVAGNGNNASTGDGGPATSASLYRPGGVAVDAAGNVYISENNGRRVRKVNTEGGISTIAGNGAMGYTGDGGPALQAMMGQPDGIAVDRGGRIYIADINNNVIRILTPVCSALLSQSTLDAAPGGQSFTVALTTDAACTWSVTGLPAWITISGGSSGSGPANIALSIAANNGAARTAQLTIAGVVLNVSQGSNVLSVSSGGVVNAANYARPVAAGSIAAVFGSFQLASPFAVTAFPLPTNVDGLSFQFAGTPLAPMFYAGSAQVNAQIPWELAGKTETMLTAGKSGANSTPIAVQLAAYAPGIFTANGQGTGQGAILDSNYRLVDASNPARAGSSYIQIYCTGLGPVRNRPATGAPALSDPLSETVTTPIVRIGGVSARPEFAGLTPGTVGLYQVNVQVPSSVSAGNDVPVVLVISGVSSNTATIAVR